MEALEVFEQRIQNLEDSRSHQNFQIQDPYSIFQVPQQEHTDLKRSMEYIIQFMIQFQSDPFDMIEARLNRLENMCRNKETLPIQSLAIPDISSQIDEN